MKKAYIILAEGFELIEALTPVDVLRRCGVDVLTVSLGSSLEVTSSNNVTVKADTDFQLEKLVDGDILILPGGYPGYENIANHQGTLDLAKNYMGSGRYIGAICGAPLALSKADLLKGRRVTSHFTVKNDLVVGEWLDEKVVIDGKLITSTGAGRSLDFALTLGEILTSAETIEKVKKGMTII